MRRDTLWFESYRLPEQCAVSIGNNTCIRRIDNKSTQDSIAIANASQMPQKRASDTCAKQHAANKYGIQLERAESKFANDSEHIFSDWVIRGMAELAMAISLRHNGEDETLAEVYDLSVLSLIHRLALE
jgi:hypothetical protein